MNLRVKLLHTKRDAFLRHLYPRTEPKRLLLMLQNDQSSGDRWPSCKMSLSVAVSSYRLFVCVCNSTLGRRRDLGLKARHAVSGIAKRGYSRTCENIPCSFSSTSNTYALANIGVSNRIDEAIENNFQSMFALVLTEEWRDMFKHAQGLRSCYLAYYLPIWIISINMKREGEVLMSSYQKILIKLEVKC